jgi:hypothetical protein
MKDFFKITRKIFSETSRLVDVTFTEGLTKIAQGSKWLGRVLKGFEKHKCVGVKTGNSEEVLMILTRHPTVKQDLGPVAHSARLIAPKLILVNWKISL